MQMCCEKQNAEKPCYDFTELNKTLDKYGKTEGSLITVLQNAQDIYGFLPREVIEYIADNMKIKPAKIYGVATFYTQFRFEPVGKYLIMLCMGTACHVNGAKAIEDAIGLELGIKDGQTTEDGLFTLNNVACIGCCSLSPVMMINGETYGMLTGGKLTDIFETLRRDAEVGK